MAEWIIISLGIIGSLLTISGVIALAVANGRNKFSASEKKNYLDTINSYKVTNDALQNQIDHQGDEIKELRQMHTESMKQIGTLQGELKTYKELPLQELSENQKKITDILLLMGAHLKIDGLDKIKAGV